MHTMICKNCGKEYTKKYKTKFCSVNCSSKYNKINKKCGGDKSSLEYFITKYGDADGRRKYDDRCKKTSQNNIGRVSPMKGKKHSNETKHKISESVKKSEYHNNIQYTDIDREKISNYMTGVFSLDWFKKKYGDADGRRKYDDRCKKISKTSYFREYNKTNNQNYSKKSQELFWVLYNKLGLDNKKIYFAELNHEYSCGTKYNFDFVFVDKKLVIEFNGNIWHGNPLLFSEDEKPNPYFNKTAKDIWYDDGVKIQTAEDKGYNVLVIWEYDYDRNKNSVIERCVEFLIMGE